MSSKVEDYQSMQHIIDNIRNRLYFDPEKDLLQYERLLSLSKMHKYLYGQALAYINLAQCYQIMDKQDEYLHFTEAAKDIAEREEYTDVMMDYYNVAGFQFSDMCDDLSAIEAYSKGLTLAIQADNQRLCACFYNNIAETFYENKAYEEAEEFYLKALTSLQYLNLENCIVNYKITYINLVCLSCHQKDLEKAKKYYLKCIGINCDVSILPLMQSQGEIRIALLENKTDFALQKVHELKEKILQSEIDTFTLRPVYLYLMEILLDLDDQELATWCMNRILNFYRNSIPYIELTIQTYRVAFHQKFNLTDETLYTDFYNTAMRSSEVQLLSTASCLKSFVSLYETQKKQLYIEKERENLQDILNKDELTKLYNRRYFDKLISKYMQDDQIKRICYIMVDVDCFKEYNDYYGHAQGDIILKTIADTLQKELPDDGYAARYGGDEFSCLLINKSDEEVLYYVQSIQSSLYNLQIEHVKNRVSDIVTLSFGINNERKHSLLDNDTLIKKADDALYEAKTRGRNTYAFYKQVK